MRRSEEVSHVLRLAAEGLNNCEIARQTHVPRTTVRDWVAGRTPRREDPDGSTCEVCGHAQHDPSELPGGDYSYLLGVYLGAGCISAAPRRVFKLRIACDMAYPWIIEEVVAAMADVMPTSTVGT